MPWVTCGDIFVMMNAEALGQRIRERRKELRITQQALSEISGVSLHTISDVEGGIGNPTLQVINKLTEPLGLELRLGIRGIDS